MVAELRHRPTTTVHIHCNSDPEKIEAQPNFFVKIVDVPVLEVIQFGGGMQSYTVEQIVGVT